jgi:hypothetical protein
MKDEGWREACAEFPPSVCGLGTSGNGGFDHETPSLRIAVAHGLPCRGVDLRGLGTIMGTSVRMIERHYGSLLQGSADSIRAKLDAHADRLAQERPTAAEAE